MTRYFFLIVLLAAALGLASAQEQEFDSASARMAELNRNAAIARAFTAITPAPQAINIACNEPLFFSPGDGSIRSLCDINNDGRADFVGQFAQVPFGRISALTAQGGYMFAHDGLQSVYRFADTNSDGVADEKATIEATVPYAERLIPIGDASVLSLDPTRGRLLRADIYPGKSMITTYAGLPFLGGLASTIMVNGNIITIDMGSDSVIMYSDPVGKGGGTAKVLWRVLWRGSRVVSIASDGLYLFILEAGECQQMPALPSVQNSCMASANEFCQPGRLHALRLYSTPFTPGPEYRFLGNIGDVVYSYQTHPMIATGNRLYVVTGRIGQGQRIESLAYTANATTQMSVFADYNLLGGSTNISGLALFKGGPVQ